METVGRKPLTLVISGPSGAGKSTFVQGLLAQFGSELHFSVSATTRPRRQNEQDGREYHFLDEAEFTQRLQRGDFLETAHVHGSRYGTLTSEVQGALAQGKNVLLDVDVQGGVQIKRRQPDAVLVFLLPPSMQVLEARLRARATDSEETIARRLRNAPDEIRAMTHYDYVVINDDIQRTQVDLVAIYRAECLRRERLVDAAGGTRVVDEYLSEPAPRLRS